jgi:BspA type Leucine rich repeat region (6 copies)
MRIKKLASLALMMLGMSTVTQAQFTFTTNNGAITINGYTASNGVVVIPDEIDDLPVTSIGDWAFYSSDVTNVIVPDSVTNIGNGAFFDCESLTNITLGSSVASIGDWAFAFCPNLTSICCRGNPPALEGDNVLYGNAATIYYLPESTGWTPIFDGHPAILWNPPVPFAYETNSDGITLTITECTSFDAVVTIPNNVNFLPVTCIGDLAFYGDSSLANVSIPNGVTNIGISSFGRCTSLTNITIPNSVITIGENAFQYCTHLTNITIPDSVTSIGPWAFFYCTGLANISIPDSVTNVEHSTFYNCFCLTNVTVPNTVTSIGSAAFYGCTDLINFTIPNGVTSIEDATFYDCTSLTSVKVPNSVKNIESFAFNFCASLTNAAIPNSVTSIGQGAFAGCTHLAVVTIPYGVTSIASGAFGNCASLTSITIPNSVTNILDSVFTGCTSLTNIVIPNSVASMGDYAFGNCANLTGIFFDGDAPSIVGPSVFGDSPNVTVYYLPGTIGWGTTFAGVMTARWLPQMQTAGVNRGQSNQFGFNIDWASGQTVVVEACTNLSNPNWQSIQTNTLTTSSTYFSDPQWTNYPNRFYRLRSP